MPGTTVADNLTLDSLAPRAGGLFRSAGRTRQAARVVAENAGLHIDVDASIESLPASDRQQVVIARALSHHVKVLILDEPTSSLSAARNGTPAGGPYAVSHAVVLPFCSSRTTSSRSRRCPIESSYCVTASSRGS